MKPKFIKNVSDATAFPLKINHFVAGAEKSTKHHGGNHLSELAKQII
jgi:hypothetical protein